MLNNNETIVFILFSIIAVSIVVFLVLKKRKKSAESIYKLIDELEKKYIY